MKPTTAAEPKPTRTPDAFQQARSIYLARKKLHAKASQLLADASTEVQSLVEAHEAVDNNKATDLVPSDGFNAGTS